METAQIAKRLSPFLPEFAKTGELSDNQLQLIGTYLDLLLRWNARINLTAVRNPDEILTRHFGESLFAARHLFPQPASDPGPQVVDVGSGAGFPGMSIKIWAPTIHLNLIESNQKKATFLREVVRVLGLADVEVFCGRAENYQHTADLVTLRAVEKFEDVLRVASRLVSLGGRLALLVGESQRETAEKLLPDLAWSAPTPIPLSSHRILLIGTRPRGINAATNQQG